jgi:hypothetical protein
LRDELIRLKPLAVSSEEATARLGGGLGHSTFEEIRRTIDAGRAEFVNLNYRKAEAMLSAVLPEIDHLPPGADWWAVASRARVELAHVYFFDEKGADAVLAFFDVLRIQEALKLDPLKFPPSLRGALDGVRASVRKPQRYTLRVVSHRPNQPVFFNGREMGHTRSSSASRSTPRRTFIRASFWAPRRLAWELPPAPNTASSCVEVTVIRDDTGGAVDFADGPRG